VAEGGGLPIERQVASDRPHDRTPAGPTRAADTARPELPPSLEVEQCFACIDNCRWLIGRDECVAEHHKAFRLLAIGFWCLNLALKSLVARVCRTPCTEVRADLRERWDAIKSSDRTSAILLQ
jgi:hypothetical protein